MSKPSGIVILSRDPKTRAELKRLFEGINYQPADIPVEAIEFSALGAIDPASRLVVLDLEDWLPSDELLMKDLRDGGYLGPLIVLTQRVDESASASYSNEQVIFFDRARSLEQLLGIAKRLIQGDDSHPRKHIRHFTNEHAEVRLEGNQVTYICKVLNISKGGAMLTSDEDLAIRIGDPIEVKINLTELQRLYSVRARVAWVRLPTFGVEFISSSR